jgi:hypothetical protein
MFLANKDTSFFQYCKKTSICLAILWAVLSNRTALAQYGGTFSYGFLRFPTCAHSTSLGGQLASSLRTDPALFLNNPSLQDSLDKQQLKLSFAPLWAQGNASTVVYNRKHQNQSNSGIALQYFNFGTFKGADATGSSTQNFGAAAYVLTMGHSRKINYTSLGINLKLAGSYIENYNSTALLFDIGGQFRHPKKDLAMGLVIKNLGMFFSNFSTTSNSTLPFDVQIGTSFKPEHMPLRFNINTHHLHQWRISNTFTTNTNLLTGSELRQSSSFVSKLFQHINIGIEALLSKSIQVNIGYNHLMRSELRSQQYSSLSGFSVGFLAKSQKRDLAFGYQNAQVQGGILQFSFQNRF